ncbi:cytochrome P450 [Aspergillus spinulosporus]
MSFSYSLAEFFWPSVKLGITLALLYTTSVIVYNRYFHPLRHFPGPAWAAISSLWYFKRIRSGKPQDIQYSLHEQFGDIARIGPNILAVRHPDAIETVFGTKNGKVWRKAAFYDSFDPHVPNARTDSFSERDDAKNAERRRLVGGLYAQGNVLRYEPCVDRLILLFQQRMHEYSESGQVFDMSIWLERYTFDVIGEVFHGRREGFGMLRDGADYNGWCYLMGVMPDIGAAITYLPWGLRSLYMLSQLIFQSSRDGVRGMFDVTKQAEKATLERWEEMQKGKVPSESDILTGLLEMVQEREKSASDMATWTVADVVTEVWAVIWAGSDTTATALTSIFYHLHRNPYKLARLRQEIDAAFEDGQLRFPVRFNDARKLPYLHAVILESMRVHPSLGIGLPRESPAGGANIGGTFIPGGVEVIVNPAAVHFDERCFGASAKEWVPERWLADTEATRRMERSMLHFGYGPRMCIGRHISNIEMYKLLPTLLREFEFEMLVDRWEVKGSWFHRTHNVKCKVKRRN